jgi:ribosomal protein S18 acetylase RimI-like enzyme
VSACDPDNIRPLLAEDLAALVTFFAHNDDEERRRLFHPFPFTAATALELCQRPRRDCYYVATRAQEIVGLAMWRGFDQGYAVPSFGLIVSREQRGAGLGRRLTEHALGEARRLAWPALRLTVYGSNERAVRLYRAFGFIESEREPVQIGGRTDCRIVMRKTMEGRTT